MAAGSPAEIEEERRLLYVAMTRARDALHLIHPQRFFVRASTARGDRHVYTPRTRFLPDRILPCSTASPGRRRPPAPPPPAPKPRAT